MNAAAQKHSVAQLTALKRIESVYYDASAKDVPNLVLESLEGARVIDIDTELFLGLNQYAALKPSSGTLSFLRISSGLTIYICQARLLFRSLYIATSVGSWNGHLLHVGPAFVYLTARGS